MSENQGGNGGIIICMILFLIFLTLKLAGIGAVAAWSWCWVLSPLWIPFAIIGVIAFVALIIWIIALMFV
jgi:hypothetical protein